MKQRWIILFVILFPILGLTQKRVAPLPKELLESSALVKYKCNFITLNDSGNEPVLYVFNKKGEITHICFIKNVKNIDWEALAYYGQVLSFVFIISNITDIKIFLAIISQGFPINVLYVFDKADMSNFSFFIEHIKFWFIP